MYFFLAVVALAAHAAIAAFLPPHGQVPLRQDVTTEEVEPFLIELSPGHTRWVTEEEKWALKREGRNFMDISSATDGALPLDRTIVFPPEAVHQSTVRKLAESLSKRRMRNHLQKFTSFYTRYYKSSTGVESAHWLFDQVDALVTASGAAQHGASVDTFEHEWGQPSIIATIPGRSNKTIVIGAHQDSINLYLPSLLAAPGADDDGSGTVTLLEALRVLLWSEELVQGRAANTVEFHWYSAEEGGLLGSQALFAEYRSRGRQIQAMLQQDMTGYAAGTLHAGLSESVGIITDFVDPALTEYIKLLVSTYCDIPFVLTTCGYACSDHASARKYGYPSAFVIESDFHYVDSKIHTSQDKIELLSFDHMLEHAKLTLAFAYEAAMAEF